MNLKMIMFLAFLSLPFANVAMAEQRIDEETVKGISKELAAAVKKGDFSVIEKYMYPGSKIIIDMDPAPNLGKKEISYEEYMLLAAMSMGMMKNAEIHDELIDVDIDEAKNQGTIEEKTTVVMEVMGTRIEDVSLSKTTYGVVDGEIKVLRTEDELLSTTPLN